MTAVHNRCAALLREFIDTRDILRRDYLAQAVDDTREALGMGPLCVPVVASEAIAQVAAPAWGPNSNPTGGTQ